KIEKPETAKAVRADFRTAKSPGGHGMGVLQSWLQKAIRRNDEMEALYAMRELSLSGFDGAVFNCLITMASEDIGLGERGLVAEILALRDAHKIEVVRKSEHNPQRVQLTHAVILCCRAQKSRLMDHALIVAFENGEKRTPPAWVLDMHTAEGKAAGKTAADFFDAENPALNPKAPIDDPYAKQARQIRTAKKKATGAA